MGALPQRGSLGHDLHIAVRVLLTREIVHHRTATVLKKGALAPQPEKLMLRGLMVVLKAAIGLLLHVVGPRLGFRA